VRQRDRRDALGVLGGALVALIASPGCGGAKPSTTTTTQAPPAAPLHLDPATDLAAAAGLVWLFDVRPRDIFAALDLIPAIGIIVPEKRLDSFAKKNAGVDLRQLGALVVARYREADLYVARGAFDPARLEKTFEEHTEQLDGRALDKATAPSGAAAAPITRLWGTARGQREQIAIFGRDAFALERGRFGPLRATEAFAQGKLKRAKPALRDVPLARAAELVGEAPLRAFAPGPFEGEWAAGLGGLLKASTAAALAVRTRGDAGKGRVDVTLVLTGAWGADDAAPGRLAAAYGRMSEDPLGKLCGLNRPLEAARTRGSPDALTLEVGLDAMEIARGLRAATEAAVEEIMAY
jgi:hypothetical protein